LREIAELVELTLPSHPPAPRKYARSSLGKVLLIALLPSLLPPLALGITTVAIGAPSTVFITSAALMISLGLAVGITTVLSRRDEDLRVQADEQEYQAQRREFEAALALAVARGMEIVAREARILNKDFPAPSDLLARVRFMAHSIWERRPSDDDFLELRLGLGRRQTCIKFSNDVLVRGSDPLIASAVQALSHHSSAPITVRFALNTRLGAFGEAESLNRLIRWLVLQAATFHAPGELALAVFSRDDRLCAWTKWLPHCRLKTARENVYLIGRRGTEATRALRAISHDILSRATPSDGPAYLVIADARSWESLSERLDRWLPSGHPAVCTVLFKQRYEELTGDCETVIDVSDPKRGRVLGRMQPGGAPEFTLDDVTPEDALSAALALAPIDLRNTDGQGAVPSSCRLADVLGPTVASASSVAETWEKSRRSFRLAAPIGVGPGGALVEIDLRRDGPHALVAGTTGSGKSELLQSLVVSLAARIPPDLLNFVLIDYKGGSTFREIAILPHVVGVVTDLDERLAARALTSLRAEMRRRERLLADASPPAANIIEYQAHPQKVPVANLLIIIDEFHRLVSEQPDFIEQMVQIAQQGRSLGVHLLLATQKPSGVVSDHIRANTNLRICLRVTDEADSRDVLGGPEAAHIPRDVPGRAFIRTGTEPLRVCQTARVSGFVPSRGIPAAPVQAQPFVPSIAPRAARRNGLEARIEPTITPPSAVDKDQAETPLVDERAEIISDICIASARSGFPTQTPPWQEYLPELLPLEAIPPPSGRRHDVSLRVTIGLLDEPELQRQTAYELDLSAGHVLIAGSANTGKTSALLTIAAAAARQATPRELHIYGIDFAGGALAPLAGLPQCGGVAAQHEPPRVRWVLQALKDLVSERLAQASAAERRLGFPHVLVLIDNFASFYSTLQNVEGGDEAADDLVEIMDIGRSVGVSFAITVERPDSLRANILALMHTRLALHLQDQEGYSTLGLSHARRSAEVIPGRALVPGHVVHELQIAHPGDFLAPKVDKQESGLWKDGGPLRIAPLPVEIRYQSLRVETSERDAAAGLVLGLREGTKPIFRYPHGEHLVVLGSRKSGRSNTLAVAIAESRRLGVDRHFIINPRRSALLRESATNGAGPGCRYAERAPDIESIWEQVIEEMDARFRAYLAGDDPSSSRWSVIIDDADVLDVPSTAEEALQKLVLRGADIGATIFFSADTQALRSSYPSGATRALLNLRTGILLAPTTPEDFDLLGVRGRPSRMPPGRGYMCEGGTKTAIQIALFGRPEAIRSTR